MTRCHALIILLGISILTGCTMGISVATTGAQAVYNRNHLKQQMGDNYITMQAYRKIYEDTNDFRHANIAIATFDNKVLLAGQATQADQPEKAEQIVKTIKGVDEVYNHVTLAAPTSGLTTLSDDWITTKIKSKLLTADNVDPNHFKVVTENGTVYLMGIVFPEEADTIVQIARTTQGVQEVYKHFYYLRICKK